MAPIGPFSPIAPDSATGRRGYLSNRPPIADDRSDRFARGLLTVRTRLAGSALPIEFEGIGPGFTGTAVELIFAIGELGGFAGPFLVGAIRDLTGSLSIALSVFVLGGLLVVFAGYAIIEPSEQPGV